MSIALMSEVWKSSLPTTDKMVLLALADAANDDGVTWMALESREGVKLDLMKKTSLSRRAVQGALKRLCDDGYLDRVDRPGKGVIWTVKGCTTCTPQEMHPSGKSLEGVQEMHRRGARPAPGGAADAPKPSTNPLTSEANASSVARAGNDNAVTPPTARPRASKFVPASWAPTAAHVAKGAELGVDVYTEAEAFRLHEFKDPKSNFDLAFHRWLRNAKQFAPRAANQNRSGGRQGWTALDMAAEAMGWDHPEHPDAA